MKIRLEEYSRGARVRLSVDDAPMTAVRGLVDAFVRALTEVGEKQEAEPKVEWSCMGPDVRPPYAPVNFDGGVVKVDPSEYENGIYTTPAGTAIRVETPAETAPEAPKRRGRPPKALSPQGEAKKAETAVTAPEPVATAEDEPGLPLEDKEPVPLSSSVATSDMNLDGEKSEVLTDGTATSGSTTLTTSTAPTDASLSDDPEITDSELQRYCAKLAQHFGTPQTVFNLAGKFVPDGAVARPTNIRDNGQRWAFVRAAEEQSGVKYHG